MTEQTKISIAAIALAPFLVAGGMTLNDVELSDGSEFSNLAAYEEYRDEILTRKISIADYSAVMAVIKYENSKKQMVEVVKDFNDLKKNPRDFVNNKINKVIE